METQTLDYNNRSYTTTAQSSNVDEDEDQEELVATPCQRGLGIDPGLLTEIEAYQGLMLDFEREYSEFLSQDLPKCPAPDSQEENANENINDDNADGEAYNRDSRRRSSGVTSSRSSFDGANNNGSSGGIPYNFDGTISCCDISYDLLVSLVQKYISISIFI